LISRRHRNLGILALAFDLGRKHALCICTIDNK
jgi:hypothetical protein